MKYLDGKEKEEAIKWFEEAARVARRSLCLNAKCGAIIVQNSQIIGRGYNGPPLDKEENRTCDKNFSPGKPKFDKTCCMHAEWRAIIDTLKNNATKIRGSKLYFSRVDKGGNLKKATSIHCTVCSRLTLDTGIVEFILWFEDGIRSYPTEEYDRVSYAYTASE